MPKQERRNKIYKPIQLQNGDNPEESDIHDNSRQIYEEYFTFREENPSEKNNENILEKIIVF